MKMHTFGSLIRIKSLVADYPITVLSSASTVVLAVRRNEEECLQLITGVHWCYIS